MKLSYRFEDALLMATRLHANQKRKGTDIPYVSHLLTDLLPRTIPLFKLDSMSREGLIRS